MDIDIEYIKESKINSIDFSNLTFGKETTDYMFECDFIDGQWQKPSIKPYAPISLLPTARVFHYGQAVFEGMKAYKDDSDNVFLFRPDENFKRINESSKRLAIPEFREDYFMSGLKQLVTLEKDWIKKGFGNSLYIRPFVIATEPALSASPANEYKFMIVCSPAQSYFSGDVRVIIASEYSRSANGGVGYAKAAGNYAAQFLPQALAKQEGYQQVIFTDSSTHEYLEEGGAMNVFFRIEDTIITAPTSERILDGVTRKSLIQLIEDNGYKMEVRPVSVKEIKEAAKKGTLKEVFGSGTAAVVIPILGFKHEDETFELPKIEHPVSAIFKESLMNIQYNKTEDKYGWRVKL